MKSLKKEFERFESRVEDHDKNIDKILDYLTSKYEEGLIEYSLCSDFYDMIEELKLGD